MMLELAKRYDVFDRSFRDLTKGAAPPVRLMQMAMLAGFLSSMIDYLRNKYQAAPEEFRHVLHQFEARIKERCVVVEGAAPAVFREREMMKQ